MSVGSGLDAELSWFCKALKVSITCSDVSVGVRFVMM